MIPSASQVVFCGQPRFPNDRPVGNLTASKSARPANVLALPKPNPAKGTTNHLPKEMGQPKSPFSPTSMCCSMLPFA